MDFLINYWWLILIGIILLVIAGYSIFIFLHKPTSEQLQEIKEWLLFAVAQAEKVLGSGTGQIKLRYVYDMFLSKFPWLAPIINFDYFSNLVDEALNQFKELLNTNDSIKQYIYNKGEKEKYEYNK